jgi:hypothetical protein
MKKDLGSIIGMLPGSIGVGLLLAWAGVVQGQVLGTDVLSPVRTVRPLELNESRYTLRAGEPVRILAPAETVAFVRGAKTRRVTVRGAARSGFVVGPNVAGDELLVAGIAHDAAGDLRS